MDSQDTEDGHETTSESVSDKKKAPCIPSPKTTDTVKRMRPKMVRQAPVDIDSDSSESKSHAQQINSPNLNLSNIQHIKRNSMEKSFSKEEDTKCTTIITNATINESHRKYSLVNPHDLDLPSITKKTNPIYHTLPHPGHTSKKPKEGQPNQSNKVTQSQNKKRKSHGLTIKIESPTTGEDSSAGIIESSGIPQSPNIYLSGVSISRGHTPVSSPGGRHSRSPSLSIPPPSPVAKKNRNRSASLAVPYHKTPPHSPGTRSLVPTLSPYKTQPNLSQFTFPQTSDPTISHLRLSGSTSALSSVLHIQVGKERLKQSQCYIFCFQDANLSSDDFHEALFLNKIPKTPKKRKRSKKSRSNSKDSKDVI